MKYVLRKTIVFVTSLMLNWMDGTFLIEATIGSTLYNPNVFMNLDLTCHYKKFLEKVASVYLDANKWLSRTYTSICKLYKFHGEKYRYLELKNKINVYCEWRQKQYIFGMPWFLPFNFWSKKSVCNESSRKKANKEILFPSS